MIEEIRSFMARDQITGKGAMTGNNVSFSMRHTKRKFQPNLQKKTFVVNGKRVQLTVAASTMRTLKKKGFIAAMGTRAGAKVE